MKHFELSQDEETGIQWYCNNPDDLDPISISKQTRGLISVYADALLNREQAGEMAEILKKFSETGELPTSLEGNIHPPNAIIYEPIFVLPGF